MRLKGIVCLFLGHRWKSYRWDEYPTGERVVVDRGSLYIFTGDSRMRVCTEKVCGRCGLHSPTPFHKDWLR